MPTLRQDEYHVYVMMFRHLLKPLALGAALVAALTSCVPTPKQEINNIPGPDLVPRPEIRLTGTNWPAADLENAFVIAGDSITFNFTASSPLGLVANRIVRSSSLNYTYTLLKVDSLRGATSGNYSYTYRIPTTTAAWIKLGFYTRDVQGQESFTFFKINVLRPTTGTNIKEITLYRQGLPATVATAGTVYAQFLSTRTQSISNRFRNDLKIDLAYGVDTLTGEPYFFSPDLPIADINASFIGFPSSQITNPFVGGIRPTTSSIAAFNADSLRRVWTPNASQKKIKIEPNKSYVVRSFPLDPLTPPYNAIINVTSIVDTIAFSATTGRRSKSIRVKANVSILTN